MAPKLVPGLYEKLITETLRERLGAIVATPVRPVRQAV